MLETIGIYVMGVFFAAAVLAKFISYFTVRKMVRSASEIHKSNHKLMKLVKAKFEHACMVSDKVQNIDAFVEKYLYEFRILGIKLCTLRHIPQKIMGILVALGVVFSVMSYRDSALSAETVLYLEWTSIFVLGILMLHILLDEKERLRATKNYVVEYLENVCMRRYEKANENHPVEEIEEEAEKVSEEEPKERRKSEQEVRIRAILEEFLA